ncbi:Hypothetical predicted protein [Mytilus galloprovincialis]|uniref:Uncharacterized protein n=1 Tax=Mytilus galloprovincialis TaxID=29158 RepID=A0A8B6E954_MYTGA|nr:Hypothetical predicted protein [Mytilus galloprovincialis]
MSIRNIDTTDGLVNGAFGSVTGIEKSQNDEIRAVFVKFDHPESVEEVLHGKNVTRKQLPLRLGWAATIHKVQGMTVKEIVVSLKRTFAPGMAYVALSRVSSLKGMHIIDFDPKVIYASEDITRALDSMESFHLSKSSTEPSDFILCSKSRSEAYTSSTSPYSTLAAAERGGVATLVHKDVHFSKKQYSAVNIEYVAIQIEKPTKLVLINIYRPPVYPLQLFCHNLVHLLDEVDSKESLPVAIMGDFNDNVFQLNSKILEILTNYGYKQIVQQITTECGSCLDLTFVKNVDKCPTCTVIPIYYSFHDVVQIYFD